MLHLISVLGTSLYKPTYYESRDRCDTFVQSAMIRRVQDELKKNGRISILLTSKAREKNWDDRVYTKYEEEQSSKWEKDFQVFEGEEKRGLYSILSEEFPDLSIKDVSIEEGKNSDEIMSIFNTIYGEIGEGDEIIFDITHSFRSIPMIITSVLRYAKTTKKCKLRGIFYGAFEAIKDGVAPIIDLSLYNEIMEWSFAAEQFIEYGNARPIKKVYNESVTINKTTGLKEITDSMCNLADAIMTSRGSIDVNGRDIIGKSQRSIEQAYLLFNGQDNSEVVDSTNLPLNELISIARQKYKVLEKDKDYEVGMAVVQLCIEFHLVNQGYTALEETIKMFLCDKYGLDNTRKNREDIVSLVLGTKARFMRDNRGQTIIQYFSHDNERSRTKYRSASEETKELYQKMCNEITVDFINISSNIGSYRNDINHFGLDNPRKSETLIKELENLRNQAENAMKNFDNYESSLSYTIDLGEVQSKLRGEKEG